MQLCDNYQPIQMRIVCALVAVISNRKVVAQNGF
jgi:hypothetical protein